MSTEKMREDFNHWYDNERKKAAPFSTVNIRDKCFEAWQASRASIEVEWPDQHAYTVPDCAGAAILDCRTAFNKAVKVKP